MRKHKTIHLKDIFWQQGASWFVSMRWEGKAAGYLASRLSMPPEVNQAIPTKLMSPKRWIGSAVLWVLLIDSHKTEVFISLAQALPLDLTLNQTNNVLHASIL